ncbi:MAG: hypothetical protein JSS63_08335 [Bacteroidetes bacterium]|nr:hypothetical protein [Bacteroidota bacterium]MBX7044568.1 hypothetical protein [Ignavibacteria bacterium]
MLETNISSLNEREEKFAYRMSERILDEFKEFYHEYSKESDKAAVIMGIEKLDNLLFQILNKILIPNPSQKDDLFDTDAPLSTFSSKINLCYRLGILDNLTTKSLNLMKRIKADMISEKANASLTSGAAADRVRELLSNLNYNQELIEFVQVFEVDSDDPGVRYRLLLVFFITKLTIIRDTISPLYYKDPKFNLSY